MRTLTRPLPRRTAAGGPRRRATCREEHVSQIETTRLATNQSIILTYLLASPFIKASVATHGFAQTSSNQRFYFATQSHYNVRKILSASGPHADRLSCIRTKYRRYPRHLLPRGGRICITSPGTRMSLILCIDRFFKEPLVDLTMLHIACTVLPLSCNTRMQLYARTMTAFSVSTCCIFRARFSIATISRNLDRSISM